VSDRQSGRSPEAERYRRASLDALEQLEWCIQYLHRLRKGGIAEALARNRATILKRSRLLR